MTTCPPSAALHRLVFAKNTAALKAALANSTPASPHPDIDALYRGQSPLTLAVSLGLLDCAALLIEAGASTLVRSSDGWSPYHEATSFGDRELMKLIYKKRRTELAIWVESKGKDILEALSKEIHDFYLEMNWTFQSWIPFVSQVCPSDTYKIYKKGTSVRIDTTLVGFERLSWIRGDISIIFSETDDGPRLVICDHQRRLVQQIYPRDFKLSEEDIEEEISVSLNTDIIATPTIDFQSFSLTRAQTGFWSFKVDRNEKVGTWDTTVWNVESFDIMTRIRKEHLYVEPLPSQVKREKKSSHKISDTTKKIKDDDKSMRQGGLVIANATEEDQDPDEQGGAEGSGAWASEDVLNNDQVQEEWNQAKQYFKELTAFRDSLETPPPSSVTMDEFFNDEKWDEYLHVGRPKNEETKSKSYKATIWMYNDGTERIGSSVALPESKSTSSLSSVLGWISGSNSTETSQADSIPADAPIPIQSPHFPLRISTILPLLDLMGMGSNQHVRSLREFFNVQLPPGFPVKIEIPINLLPLSALITFQNIKTSIDIASDKFTIPGKKEKYRHGEVISSKEE